MLIGCAVLDIVLYSHSLSVCSTVQYSTVQYSTVGREGKGTVWNEIDRDDDKNAY